MSCLMERRTEMRTCPNCGKVLTYEDYETYYDEETEDTAYCILCSSCGYDETEEESEV